MASNPNRSRDLLESDIMRVSVQPHLDGYSTFRALDEKARTWLQTNAHERWYGDEFVIPQIHVESLENKFIDSGGQLL